MRVRSCSFGTWISRLGCPAVWAPAVFLAAATTLFWWTDLDVALVRLSSPGCAVGPDGVATFPAGNQPPWLWLNRWGEYPALLLGGGGLAAWLASFFWAKLKPWRDPGLFYALLLVVGPGILVNVVLKPHWNRPRPNATAPFGGPFEFLPVWQRGADVGSYSFPCGHAAAGFFLMAPAFVVYRSRPRAAAAFLLLGIGAGCIIGVARMAAGCHFPSDVLWSGGIVYYAGLALAAPFRFGENSLHSPPFLLR